MVCFTLTWICQREVVHLLSWGKKLAAAFQHQTEVFSLKGNLGGVDIFSCPVNPFSGLFILCTALTIIFYPAPCEEPSAPSSSVSPAWTLTGRLAGSGMMVQAAFFSPHLQSRHRTAVHLPLKLQRKGMQNYSEWWWCQMLSFGGGGFLFLITRKWPHFMIPESHLWNFNMCDLMLE